MSLRYSLEGMNRWTTGQLLCTGKCLYILFGKAYEVVTLQLK